MIRSLDITGFRAFERLTMRGLERVNLLVGKNNSGKTSVLEAIQFLASQGDPSALYETMSRRGEQVMDPRGDREYGPQADVSHLFHGHRLEPGREFRIEQRNGGEPSTATVRVIVLEDPADDEPQAKLFKTRRDYESAELASGLALRFHWSGDGEEDSLPIPLLRTPSHVLEEYGLPPLRQRFRRSADRPPVQFITTAALTRTQAAFMWDGVAATPDELRTVAALKIIEEDVRQLRALVNPGRSFYRVGGDDRGGFVVNVRGVEPRVPIGSMGDGIWRMLGLALSLATARGGLLLVDEIDTGLHYTVMRDMWRLVLETANRLNLQVFATTHSLDCWLSLADVIEDAEDYKRRVAVHRIEAGREESIRYSGEGLAAAARHELEVR